MTVTFTAGQTLAAASVNADLANPTGMLTPFAGGTAPCSFSAVWVGRTA